MAGYGTGIVPYAGESVWLAYYDQGDGGYTWWGTGILPYAVIPPPGLWHRPANDIRMVDETQGWAVGEKGDIFMYPFPNFMLALHPLARAVKPGGTATYDVQSHGVISGSAFNITITPTLPITLLSHVAMNLSPSRIQVNETALLTINVGFGAPLGAHELEIQGTAVLTSHEFVQTTLTRRVDGELYVTNNPIYSISPTRGPAGTVVTIDGEGFGPTPGSVTFNGHNIPGGNIQSWSSTRIQVEMPDSLTIAPLGSVEGMIRVVVSDTSNGMPFMLEPHVEELEPVQAEAGDVLTINGTTFGPDPGVGNYNTGLYNVRLNSIPVADASFLEWGNDRIRLTIPDGTTSGPVVVTSNGWRSNEDVELTIGSLPIYLPLILRQ
jgi:hypothetical protein